MEPAFLFNTAGEYVAFASHGNLFTPDCVWLGALRGEEVRNTAGEHVGRLLPDGRLARDRSVEILRQELVPPAPMRPVRPLPPKRRLLMAALGGPLEDVFHRLPRPLTALLPLARLLRTAELAGCEIRAADGVLLGVVSRDSGEPGSLAARPAGAPSVLDPAGPYGSADSPLSAFNPGADTPPRLERGGEVVAALTVNPDVPGRVDPNALVSWLAMR